MSDARPLVAGFHLVWTAYGRWLPNDPRGSTSHEFRNQRIAELGELHHGRKLEQPSAQQIREFYQQAGDALQHDLLKFNEGDVRTIAEAFAKTIVLEKYTCYACAIMWDHVHALIRKHKHSGEEMIKRLQAASRAALIIAGRRAPDHPVWGGPGWKVFLSTQEDIRRITRYIEANPVPPDCLRNSGDSSRNTTGGSRANGAEGARSDKSPFRAIHRFATSRRKNQTY